MTTTATNPALRDAALRLDAPLWARIAARAADNSAARLSRAIADGAYFHEDSRRDSGIRERCRRPTLEYWEPAFRLRMTGGYVHAPELYGELGRFPATAYDIREVWGWHTIHDPDFRVWHLYPCKGHGALPVGLIRPTFTLNAYEWAAFMEEGALPHD